MRSRFRSGAAGPAHTPPRRLAGAQQRRPRSAGCVLAAVVVLAGCGDAGSRTAPGGLPSGAARSPGTGSEPVPSAPVTPAVPVPAPGTTTAGVFDDGAATAAPEPPCPGAVPTSLGLDAFYTQHCSVDGIPVVAHADVDPRALRLAVEATRALLAHRPDVAAAIADSRVRIGIIGRAQRTTQMPEWSDLYEAFPGTDWDERARGLGATVERPLVGAGEENLLCLAEDRYLGESILVHELAHTIHEFGVRVVEPSFDDRLDAAWVAALDAGTWDGTYAATNEAEYWAEGVQSYFDANLGDTFEHGPIDTRAELEAQDPALFALADEVFGPSEWRPACP